MGFATYTDIAGPPAVPTPPPGAAQFNPATGHFYEVVTGSWDEAETQGVAMGGHLVTINDAAEQQWLVQTFQMDFPVKTSNGVDTVAAYWIGLNDRDSEGIYRWTSGELLSQTGFGADFASPPWSPLQPDNGGQGENLGAMNFRICDFAPGYIACYADPTRANSPGLWNDYGDGSYLSYGIIEYPPPQWSVDPHSTFLLAVSGDSTQLPLVIDLIAVGIAPGQLVRLVQKGDFSKAESGPYSGDEYVDLVAVFSSDSGVRRPEVLDRVPGAIDAGEDYVSDPAGVEAIPTDIPQDFRVFPEAVLVVPAGATHLMVGVTDSYYADNSDPDGDFGVDLITYPGVSADPSVSIGANPSIGEGTTLRKNVVIGDDVLIRKDVWLSQGSTVGDDVSIGDSTTLNQNVSVGDGTEIGSNVVSGQGAFIGENVTIDDGTTIGQGAAICGGATIGSSVEIGKNVLIQTNAVVPSGSSFKAQKTAPSPSSCLAP